MLLLGRLIGNGPRRDKFKRRQLSTEARNGKSKKQFLSERLASTMIDRSDVWPSIWGAEYGEDPSWAQTRTALDK